MKSRYSLKTQSLRRVKMFAATSLIALGSTFANAQPSDIYKFELQPLPLAEALIQFSEKTNVVITVRSDLLAGKTSPAMTGEMSAKDALSFLLQNTAFEVVEQSDGTIIIRSPHSTNASLMKNVSLSADAEDIAHYESNLAGDDADDETDGGKMGIEEVLVTASRRTQALQDVAMSIASVNPDDFTTKGLTSLEDIIDYTPGVNFNSNGATGAGQITMRGASQEGFIPVTAIYLDDVPITSSTAFSFGTTFFFDGLLGDLERVEIAKGPQGTLYGAGAMGGVVRYINKDPALDEIRGSFSAEVSSTKQASDVSQIYRAMISAPLVEDKVGVTISGFYNDQAGYVDRLDIASGLVAEEDYNTAEIYGGAITALVKFSDVSSLKISGLYQKNNSTGGDSVEFTVDDSANPVLVPTKGKYAFALNFNTADSEYKKIDATFNYDLNWAEFTSVTGYAKNSSEIRSDLFAVPFFEPFTFDSFADIVTGSAPGTTTSVPQSISVFSKKFIQEARLTSADSNSFEWQAGLFFVKEDTSNDQLVVAQPINFAYLDISFPSTYKEFAAFANATFYITPDFDVTAGLRYSDNSINTFFGFTGLLVPPLDQEDSIDDEVTTYLLNARWRVGEDLSLYTRVASGYRPAFSNVPIVDINTGQTAPTFVNSDSLWSYEVGAKGNAIEGKFSYDVALWFINWSDFQSALVINNLGTAGNSDQGISSHGFEGTFNALLTDQLRVSATIAYAKSTLDGDSAPLGALKGEKTRFLPEWTASLRADYDYTIGDIDATLGFGLRYVGEYNTAYTGGFSDTLGQNVGFGTVNFPIESYVLADLNASFTSGQYTLNIYATNLFDNYTFGGGAATATGPTTLIATGGIIQPRTIGASVAVSF